MKTIQEILDLKDKKVLMRVDFDVPVQDGKIQEVFRIEKQKETLEYLTSRGAKVVLVGHISDVDSFGGLIPQLHMILGREIGFIKDISGISEYLNNYVEVGLLENIRKYPGEKENDPELAEQLANGFDLYINNAFAVSHRDHASISAIAKALPSYAGLQLEAEVQHLQEFIDAPAEGKIVIIGGAKGETKVPVIKNFLSRADAVLVGGVVANDILKAKGQDIGPSVVDENPIELLQGVNLDDSKLFIPNDFVISEGKYLDIGTQSIGKFQEIIKKAKLIVWNGPMGLFEKEEFSGGTKSIAESIQESGAKSIVGGGDTIAAINQWGMMDKFSFVSTGGGAMLEFLSGNELPGIKSLQ